MEEYVKYIFRKVICFILAAVFCVIGGIGLLLPVVPQVPFFAAAAVFLMMGSERFSSWVKHSKIYRKHLRSYVLKNEFLRKVLNENPEACSE